LGLIAGALAKILMPGKDPGGCLVTILLGIAGAFVGGLLGKHTPIPFLQAQAEARISWPSILTATVGAVLLLLLYRLFLKKKEE
ncbi:MAG: GlsB/YeaQ/YmgE family stress response membrane protein, partial [Akkermansiaceae bacterium]|nr:GlsB/YeaQ/YmgE family stress response membrane protein [Akkermansiaceae bacterium]